MSNNIILINNKSINTTSYKNFFNGKISDGVFSITKKIDKDRIFLAGASGMAGSAILRALKKNGYGENKIGGELLLPSRKNLNLLNFNDLKYWFEKNRPNVVIIAAARVGGILANSNFPADFILENIKIQSNIIELSYLYGVKRLLFLSPIIFFFFAN